MNYIYEEDLIYESNRERVDWRQMLGKEVRYMFDGVEGTFTVDSYPTKYHVIISNGTTKNFKIKRTSIRDCKLSHFLKKVTHEYKYPIGYTRKTLTLHCSMSCFNCLH